MKRGISMKKRVLVTLLAFCLVAALCVVGAAAEDLPEAENNVITLDRSYSGHLTVTSGENITLDLNGYTLTNSDNDHTIVVQAGGTLTVIDSSAEKTGKVDNVNHGKAALVNNGTATLQGGTFDRSHEAGTLNPYANGGNSYYTVANYGTMYIYDGVTIQQDGRVNGGTRGYYSSLIRNGGQNSTAEMTIYGGLFSGGLNTIKNDDYGVLTINSGTFTNIAQAAVLNWNVAEINGGDFTLDEGTAVSVVLNGYIDDTVDKGQLTITGGTFNGNGGDAVQTMDNGSNGIGTVEISGGTFDGDIWIKNVGTADSTVTISENAVINGDIVNANSNNTLLISDGAVVDGSISGSGTSTVVNATVTGTVTEDTVVVNSSIDGQPAADTIPDNVVAIIDGKQYATLQDAVDAANGTEGTTTIKLVRNATGSGIKVQSGNNLIFDLGGFTYTVNSGVGSGPQYATNCFQLLQNSDITIRNGTIVPDGVANLAIVIQNYSNLTLEDVVLDGRPLRDTAGKEYTLSNNNGEININAGTVIYSNGGEGDMAMDVCWASSYQNGARVTVNEGALIDGDVELGLWNQTAYADNQSVLTMNGGTITGEVTIMVEDSVYGSTEEAIEAVKTNVTINGGTYGGSVDAYIDSPNEANAKVTVDGQHSYFSTLAEAQQAAAGNPNAVVTDLSVKPASGATYTVTLNYNDGRSPISATIVAAGDNYVLPTPVRSGYTFNGWRLGSSAYYKGGESVRVTSDMTFTAVWDLIEIPDTYEINVEAGANGEASTSLTNASAGSTVTITATPDEGYRVGSVTVTGPDGRVEVTRVNATTYTFVMPEGAVDVTVRFEEANALSEPFTDVNEGQWFYEYVAYVYSNGLMEGTSATTFEPDTGMTRAMVWAVLARMDGQSVSGASWMETARSWAMAEGVSDGTDPNSLITREQLATMLYRYAGSPAATGNGISAFTDAASVSSWAVDAMNWALGEGIITGMGGGTLSPQGTATRAQAAAILMRFVER